MRLVVFDLDGTLLTGDSDEYWLRFLVEQGEVGHGEIEARNRDIQARYAAGLASAEEFCFFYLGLLRGRELHELDRLHAEFMRTIIVPNIPAAARAMLDEARPAADLLVMSTATNRFLTEPIAAHLGFEHLIATDPEQDATGRYTGGCVGLPNMRANKIARLEAWLAERGRRLGDFEESWFYSDSRNDLPLLSKVTHPVAVDPDPELARHAAAQGWPVLHIHPVAGPNAASAEAQAAEPPRGRA
jgi:HAD superfamily hydrolase (TIGR01490 family)